jgi:coenzyme F420-reducing hydrogenase delta subunit/NAD-dependent dihydropyrimidine dehydrogenase PreA subunit
MCSGRIDLEFILRAFSNGVDGVFIGGCRLNECNYITHGNYHALNLALLGKKIMAHIGLNPDRLRIEFMSAGEGIHFTETVDDFVRTVSGLGPLGQGEGVDPGELSSQLETVTKLVPYIKIAKGEKLAAHLESEDAYDEYFSNEEVESLLRDVVSFHIDPEKCRACMICLRKCPVDAITGGKNRIHVIDQDQCIKCGTCFDVCPARFAAVEKISGEPVPPPIPEAQRDIVRK